MSTNFYVNLFYSTSSYSLCQLPDDDATNEWIFKGESNWQNLKAFESQN